MVTYLQQHHAYALPRQRWEQVRAEPQPRRGSQASAEETGASQLFTGSLEAVNRRRAFSGPGEHAYEDRSQDEPLPAADAARGRA